MEDKTQVIEIGCHELQRELVNYMETDVTPALRARIDHHLKSCKNCIAVYAGLRNVVQLLGSTDAVQLPRGFSERLYNRVFTRHSS